MKRVIVALLLVACGDGDEDGSDSGSTPSGADCTVVTLDIDVVDADGAPETAAEVTLENSAPCTEIGEGAYRCTATEAGDYHLTVRSTTDPLLAVYTTLLSLPEPSCTPFPVSVQMTKSAI